MLHKINQVLLPASLLGSLMGSSLLLTACGGGDTTAPSVSSTSPADAASAVATNSNITATFIDKKTTRNN